MEKVPSDLRFHSKYRDEKNGLMFLRNVFFCKNEKVSSDLRFHSKYRDEKNGLMFLKNDIFL